MNHSLKFNNDIFGNLSGKYIDERKLYLCFYNKFPNTVVERDIDTHKYLTWFESEYKDRIIDKIYLKKSLDNSSYNLYEDDIYYFIYTDVLIYIDNNLNVIRVLFYDTEINIIDEIHAQIIQFRKVSKNNPKMDVIIRGRNGLMTETKNLNISSVSLETNYNDDFIPINDLIVKRLSKKNDKGLVLLHGKPGTGKTSYIRHLIFTIKKKIIFIPPNIAHTITGPELMGLLLDYSNSILIIEDAEQLIQNREHKENSPVSALLNLSDGLLSDILNIQIICTFNTDLSNVDKALLRKGRIIAQYEFNDLDIVKANNLSKELGYVASYKYPQCLTDIYNQDEGTNLIEKKSKIGFN